MIEGTAELKKKLERTIGRQARREGVPEGALPALPVDEAVLGEAAPLITGIWLATALKQARAGLPKLVNFDGEELVLCEVRFPLADPALAEEVAACLDRLPDVHRDEPGQPSWTWLAAETTAKGKARAANGNLISLHSHPAVRSR